MKIKVKVDSNLRIKNVFEPPLLMDLQEGENTLKDVLQKLSGMYPYLKFIERGEMGDDLRHIYLKWRKSFFISRGDKEKDQRGRHRPG